MEPDREIIYNSPLLRRLTREDLTALADSGHIRSFAAGTMILREGDPADSLYAVIRGSVRIAIHALTGETTTLAILGPGECFGELALLDGRPRSASAIALEPTETLVVTRESFANWLSDRPRAALVLLETVSLRLRRTDEAYGDLTFLDLPQRLARQLVKLAAAAPVEARGGGPQEVRINITQSGLASLLGVSRESVNKQLNLFAKEGWLELGRGSVTVRDLEALRSFV